MRHIHISRACISIGICSVLGACSAWKQPDPPKKAYEEVSIEDTLHAANVRDTVVLHTHESIGGAAERQTDWADYFYDTYHTGVGERVPVTDKAPDTINDAGTDKKDVAKDHSIYADRSIYSMDKAKKLKKSVVAKKPTKKKASKKKAIQKKKAYKAIKSTTVNGKKVAETIVELKDAK